MSDAAPEKIKVTDWYALRRVLFFDPAYGCSWVHNSAELARFFAENGGYVPLTAFQLREWMKAQAAGGAEGSVCFFTQDIAPDQVAGTEDAWAPGAAAFSRDIVTGKGAAKPSQSCLLMAYLRAGGRVVWVGDIPFYYLGRRGGDVETWGIKGQSKVLGLDSIWDVKAEPRLTEAGREWGLTTPGNSSRCVPARDVTAALTMAGEVAMAFFKNFNPELPASGFLRLREFMPLPDLLRAAEHGLEEEAEAETPAPAAAPGPAAAEDGAVPAGSGTFVVDKQRALDKLMRFQLPDPETCLLPIMRCALAGKASGVSIKELSEGGLEIAFDGAPLSRERLEDPYSALFETRSAANSAARHLATGLLCALRLNPKMITVGAGAPGARFRLRIDELGKEQVQPSEGPGDGTVVKLLWLGVVSPFRNRNLLSHVRWRCYSSPVPVLINNADIPRGGTEAGSQAIHFEEGALHGFISVPKWPAAASRLTVSVNNVMLDTPLTVKLPFLPVTGYLNNDDFTMNISQTWVVNNSRCSKAVAVVAGQVPLLLAHVLKYQEKNLPAAGRAMAFSGMSGYWKECVESGRPVEPGLLGEFFKKIRGIMLAGLGADEGKGESAEAMVRETARVTLWLREACGRLLNFYEKDRYDPQLKALWQAPVFLTINAGARSLAQVEELAKKIGFVPFSRMQYPDSALPFDVLWCPSEKDLELIGRWDTADMTVKIPHYGANPAAAEEFMGGGGLRFLAARHDLYIAPSSRKTVRETQQVEISLSDIKMPEPVKQNQRPPVPPPPPPPPPPPAAAVKPEKRPARPARRPLPPMPTEKQLAEDPAANFPEYLYRRASRIRAAGARLVANFIRERSARGKWAKEPLAAEILASGLPPLHKADYLLSVFYSEYNRREVKLTDTDDVNFQRALAELLANGGKQNEEKDQD
ncbi:MAG: hypothetical protein HY550_05540 [Elusimicrobia bacterium]|nr:hypothetical protein [Elusimicrobiota bacterium]